MAIDFTELWEKTIQSQYGTSPHIKGIIESFAKRIDPTIDIETFYRDYFDPRTAVGVGLDIWGVIVGADRLIEVDSYDFFGLLGQNMSNMDNAPFWVEKGSTNIYRMSDPAFRELIFLSMTISFVILQSVPVERRSDVVAITGYLLETDMK